MFSHHCLSPDVPASGLKSCWEPMFQHRPPHQLLATELYELGHKADEANHQGGNADNQDRYGFNFHMLSPPFCRCGGSAAKAEIEVLR